MSDELPPLQPPGFAGAPECETPTKCRFVRNGPVKLSDEHWQPAYDRQGNIINALTDRGAMPMRCETCGRDFDHPL